MDLSKQGQGTSRHSLPPVNVRQPSIGQQFAPHMASPQPKTPVPQSPAVAAPGRGGNQPGPFQNFPQQHGQQQQHMAGQGQPHQHAPGQPGPSHISGAVSPPSQMPGSPDPTHDLPMELLQKGWRKFWSKREQRWYFFNKFTNQSMWEMPPIGSPVGASRHDPLGIQITEGKGQPSPNPQQQQQPNPVAVSAASPGMAPVRRKSSVDGNPLSPTMRRDMLKGLFWDFMVESNATMQERFPCVMPPPHNDMELMRANHVSKLRHQYHELCMQRESISAPSESFNRWLLERMVVDKGNDPMLPSKCDNPVSPSMMREIMGDIPIKLYRPNLHSHARKLLVRYAEAAKKMIESRTGSSESRKVVKWNAEDTFNWLRSSSACSIDECMKRLAHLKEQCGPHLCEVARSSIENICTKMYNLSCETCQKLQQRHWEVLKEHQIEEPPPFTRPPSERKMRCYNIQMAVQTPRLPTVDVHEEGTQTCLRYKGEMMKINTQHMMKLDALYQFHCRDDPTRHNFLPRVWCLLRRYQTLFGLGDSEGHSLQGALPTGVFKALNEHFGVTFECFASPLNCYFKQYCSAFADTDSFFGSRGPILDFQPIGGSFEANPPFGEEIMEATVVHFEKLLERTTDPLSFICFVPDWRDPPINALKQLEASRFKRRQEVLPMYEHEYRNGNQHCIAESSVCSKAAHGTLMIFLQNDEGNRMWPPTDEGIQAVLEAAKPTSAPSTPHKKRAYEEQESGSVSPPRRRPRGENEFNGSGKPEPSQEESSSDRLSASFSSPPSSSTMTERKEQRTESFPGASASYTPPVSRDASSHYTPPSSDRDYKRNSPRGGGTAHDTSALGAGTGLGAAKQVSDLTSRGSLFPGSGPLGGSIDPVFDSVPYGLGGNGNDSFGGSSVITHTSPANNESTFIPVRPAYSTTPAEQSKPFLPSPAKSADGGKTSNLGVINWFVDTKSKTTHPKTLADYTMGNTTGNWTEAIRPLEAKPVLSTPVKFESKSGSKWTPVTITKPTIGSPEKVDEGIDVYEWKDDDEDDSPVMTTPVRKGAKALGKGAMKLKAVKRLDSTLASGQVAAQKSTTVGGRTLRSRRGNSK